MDSQRDQRHLNSLEPVKELRELATFYQERGREDDARQIWRLLRKWFAPGNDDSCTG